MTEELKPCPFCGGEAEVNVIGGKDCPFSEPHVRIWCIECGAGTRTFWRYRNSIRIATEKAIEAWNRRAE